MIEIMQTERIIGLDFIKVIACIFIVALHTINVSYSPINFIIISFAVSAIPLFIMVNGYLMFQKTEITYGYIGNKIFRILIVCFSWEALHALAYFCYYHKFRNFVKSFLLDFLQQGLFFHFWFMGTLIILYLLLPFLYQLYQQSEKIYIGILIGLGVACAMISFLMIVTRNQFILKVPQSLRLWYWLFYYMLGGLLSKKKVHIQSLVEKCSLTVKIAVMAIAIALLVGWQWIIGNIVMGHYVLETFYGSAPIIISVTVLFIYILGAKVKWKKEIAYLSGLSMGIYIIHPFVLAVLQKFFPIFISGNTLMNISFWIATVIICGAITLIMNRLPIVKELLKL